MSELSRRVVAITGRAAGNTVGPTVAALCSLAGVATGHPELVGMGLPVGALAGAVTEEGVDLLRAVWNDRLRRVGRFTETASTEGNVAPEELLRAALDDERTRELLARAVDAASRTFDEWKIDLLAEIYVRAAKDPALVDDALLLVEALRQVDTPHLRFLRVLTIDRSKRITAHASAANELDRHPRRITEWRIIDVIGEDKGLSAAVDAIASKLVSVGLIHMDGSGRITYDTWVELSRLGRACLAHLVKRANANRRKAARTADAGHAGRGGSSSVSPTEQLLKSGSVKRTRPHPSSKDHQDADRSVAN